MVRLVKQKILHYGSLAKGCKQCLRGRKSVLFITSKCHYKCYYCPISMDKRKKDVTKINEKFILHPDSEQGLQEVFDEIRLCQSKGVGITGGDPLATLERTFRYVKELKKEFGSSFHIHIYTSPQFVTKEKLLHLDSVGLNEIRFHLNVADNKLWKRILFAKELHMRWGVEIPALPDKLEESKKMLDFCKAHNVMFVNVNELEYSDSGNSSLAKKGFFVKSTLSYGILDSEAVAQELVAYGRKIGLRVHYCSASFKDAVQLGNRFLLRAQSVALPCDEVDSEGLLTRGELRITKKRKVTLEDVQTALLEEIGLSSRELFLENNRLLLSPSLLKRLWPKLLRDENVSWTDEVQPAIVKEYPTDDHFIVEKTLL